MSNPPIKRATRAVVLSALFAFAAAPAVAQAAPVDLGTVTPFAVLGGTTVTNSGPSVLTGNLGLAPGPAVAGFEAATVNGVTHVRDEVAFKAQEDLITAYDVAAGEPVAPDDDLTGENLGERTLTPGAYAYTSDALLTGTLTLDGQGDPNAQFVFKIGTQLTTASASAVMMTGGASACNVFWQIGSSAVIGSSTAFKGNVMALASISLQDSASVIGRLLARNGQVSLINNVVDAGSCQPPRDDGTTDGTPTDGTPTDGTPTDGTTTGGTTTGGTPTGGTPTDGPEAGGSAVPPRRGRATLRRGPRAACRDGFRASVRGSMIRRVVFRVDGRRVASIANSPFRIHVPAAAGARMVRARVTFRDATRAKNLKFRYRACAAAALQPRRGPSQFTG